MFSPADQLVAKLLLYFHPGEGEGRIYTSDFLGKCAGLICGQGLTSTSPSEVLDHLSITQTFKTLIERDTSVLP